MPRNRSEKTPTHAARAIAFAHLVKERNAHEEHSPERLKAHLKMSGAWWDLPSPTRQYLREGAGYAASSRWTDIADFVLATLMRESDAQKQK